MRSLVLLAIVIASLSCRTKPASPPADTGAPVCQRLQRDPILDGSLVGVHEALKRDFPDWARTTQPDTSAKLPWVGLPFSVSCNVEAYNQIVVSGATCDDVEALLIDPGRWPEVYTNAHAIEAPPTLMPGAQFAFRTFGSRQSCTVMSTAKAERGFQLGWTCEDVYLTPIPDWGILPLARSQHRWSCTESNGDVVISIQDCQAGRDVDFANDFLQGEMKDMVQRGQEAWLEGLKCKLDDAAWSVQARAGA